MHKCNFDALWTARKRFKRNLYVRPFVDHPRHLACELTREFKTRGVMMKQQFTRIALFAAAIWTVNGAAFAQQSGGATRGSSTGQTTQGTTETRPSTPSTSA